MKFGRAAAMRKIFLGTRILPGSGGYAGNLFFEGVCCQHIMELSEDSLGAGLDFGKDEGKEARIASC